MLKLCILFFLKTFTQALPLSRLTALSPEVPPSTTKTFLNFFLITNDFLISNSRLTPNFSFTFFTLLISFSISDDFAFPLFTKKLECFEITASPTDKSSHPVSLIICQAFLSLLRFLNVLPQVLI